MINKGRPKAGVKFALSIALVTMLAPVATDMYLASMPEIARKLGVTYASVQLTLTVFLLAQGAGQLLFGPVIDRFGRRLPLLCGLGVFILGSIWAGFSGSLATLLLSRFVQGLSGALLLVVGFSSVRDVSEGSDSARLFAILLTIEGLAPVFAPIAGGYIDGNFGWRVVLWSSAIMGAAALVNSWLHLPESLPKTARIPLKPSIIAATYKRIGTDSNFLLPTLALSSVFFYLFAYIGGGSYLYQNVFGLSPEGFGLVFGVSGVAVMAGAVASSRMVKTQMVSGVAVKGISLIILGTCVCLASALMLGESAIYGIVPGFAIALFGLGITEPAMVSLSMASQRSALGSTAALMGAMHLVLSSLSTPISGILLPKSAVYWFVFLFVASLMTMVLALLTRRALRRTVENPEWQARFAEAEQSL